MFFMKYFPAFLSRLKAMKSGPYCKGIVFDGDEVLFCEICPSNKNQIVKSIVRSSLQEAREKKQKEKSCIALALPASKTLVKQIIVPKVAKKHLFSAILDQLEQMFSLRIEDFSVVYDILHQDENGITVTAFITRKTDIHSSLKKSQEIGLEPLLIIPKTVALASFISHFHLPSWQYVIDLGTQEICLSLLYEGHVVENILISESATVFTSIEENPPSSVIEKILQELFENTHLFAERYDIKTAPHLTVTGKFSSSPLATALLSEYLKLPLSEIHRYDEEGQMVSCATCIGAAFCANPDDFSCEKINMRHGEFVHPQPLFHWKKPLISFAGASFAICALILLHGYKTYNAVHEEMKKKWIDLLSLTNTKEDLFSKEHLSYSIKTIDDITNSAQMLFQDVQKQTLFPLDPKIPKFSHVISWITSQITKVQKNIQDTSPLEIQNLHYTFLKYPTKLTPMERYQVQVTLDFTTSSVALARAFHEQISQKNPYIQEGAPVTWTPGSGKYKIGFYLKDLTIYPPRTV